MLDLSDTIVAKSDQLNASDLISGEITVKITKVSKTAGEQPVSISYEGDNGKPYKPCKSMLRVLIHAWGRDGLQWVGRSMTLFRNEKVKWAGEDVGGIRISSVSHIEKELTIALAETRKSIKSVKIKPLVVSATPPAKTALSDKDKLSAAKKAAEAIIAEIEAADDVDVVVEKHRAMLDRIEAAYPDLNKTINDALLIKTRVSESADESEDVADFLK